MSLALCRNNNRRTTQAVNQKVASQWSTCAQQMWQNMFFVVSGESVSFFLFFFFYKSLKSFRFLFSLIRLILNPELNRFRCLQTVNPVAPTVPEPVFRLGHILRGGRQCLRFDVLSIRIFCFQSLKKRLGRIIITHQAKLGDVPSPSCPCISWL